MIFLFLGYCAFKLFMSLFCCLHFMYLVSLITSQKEKPLRSEFENDIKYIYVGFDGFDFWYICVLYPFTNDFL